ncbi:MAG: beta-xylosidase, partial [Chthoniobacteraceae bacterium]
NTFRMFSKMSGQRLDVQSSAAIALDDMMKNGVRDMPDVSALASMDGGRLCVLAWHYHEDDVPGPDAAIDLTLAGLPKNSAKARVEHYRIDADHSNAYEVWKKLGSPPNPTPEQQTTLEKAGQLAVFGPAEEIAVKEGSASIRVQLPRQAVSLLVVTPSAP